MIIEKLCAYFIVLYVIYKQWGFRQLYPNDANEMSTTAKSEYVVIHFSRSVHSFILVLQAAVWNWWYG